MKYSKKPAEISLITALAVGNTQAEAAQRSGLSERTVARRLANPEFRAEVSRARSLLLERTLGMLAEATTGAVTTLVELATSGTPSVRLGAARAILDQTTRFRDHADLAAQLDRIEEALDLHMVGRAGEIRDMSIRSRIAKLTRLKEALRCPECNDSPRFVVFYVGDSSRPTPAPCGLCGNSKTVVIQSAIPRNPTDPFVEDGDG